MIKAERELIRTTQRVDGVKKARLVKERKHFRLRLTTDDGRKFTIVVASTPSCPRALKNHIAYVRRVIRGG